MRGFWAGLVVLAAMVVIVLVPASGSQGASETPIDSLRLGPLDDGHQATGTVLLKAGVRYHLVVTGYVTQAGRDPSAGSYADDAFYRFDDSLHPGPPSPPGILFLGVRSEATGHVDFLSSSAEDTRDRPPYDPGHHYENHFTLKEDARLVISATGLGDSLFTYGGPGFVVSVSSGGGSTTTPPSPKLRRCTRASAASAHATGGVSLLCSVDVWVASIGFTGVGPGDTAVAVSPPLDKLTLVHVTVGGVTDEDAVAFGRLLQKAKRRGASFKDSCLVAFHKSVSSTVTRSGYFKTAPPDDQERYILVNFEELAGCLEEAKVLDALVTSHAVTAQAPACGLTAFQATVQSRRGRPTQVHVTAGGATSAPLHVTCVSSQGRIDLTVESRQAGVPLSKFLGPRLAIGIVRSPRDAPGGQVTARFDRP
jgi:hypothetical protein